MAEELDKVDVVVVGMGWAGGIISAEMAKAGRSVVGLEKGIDKNRSDYVGVKDELRFDNRYQIMQNLTGHTVTSRNEIDETALPVRTMQNMQLGTDVGGASVHWAGATYRYWPYEFENRVYNRLGLKRYFFSDKVFAAVTVHAHWAKAEAVEFGVGYRL